MSWFQFGLVLAIGLFIGFKMGKWHARSKIQAAIDDGRVRSQFYPITLIP